ncbi:hypothetical protein GX51_06545 [Blastomyces parvus]|uniref:Uncharacterized protein n=1 Tax=Blastomyces parvus TaxID=2060905 RepID=A0A2B7WQP2_9EURO|nr:hypothetical protein GX51_06545 [Blastomyces parvus]
MERSMFTDTELQLTTERSTKYQGTAKINLSQIAFHPSLSRELDQKNVERLCEIFNKNGCRRLDIQHHVTAVVSQQHLANALHAAHVTAHALMTNPPDRYPQLQFPTGQIRCLHGQHRLKAGEELLPPSDQWWTVDIYLDDISSGLQASLVDEYSNEKPPSDGEVYRKVHQYQYEANSRFEERWKSRLSSNKAKRLRQLSSPAHVDVRAAFDALLAIPGLWNGMNLGSLHRVLALNCDEEIVTYLTHVKQFWSSLVDDDRDKMMKIDLHTVEILQLLAPGVSRKDAKTVRGVVLGGEAFANFNDSDRAAIWNKLQGKREIIPSLHTFFQDIYYLEACANCVKRLVALSRLRPTLRSAVWGSLKPPDPAVRNCMIQTSETGQRRSGSPAQRAELGYRQLWLYAMRHYPKMPREPESDDLVARPGHEKADETALHEMAVLAQNLGFDSTRITDLIELSPDRQIARAVLLKARDPERFRYDSGIFETLIGRIAECFSLAVPVERQLSCDFTSGSEAKLNARCGLPHARAQQQDRRFLFLDQLHTNEMPAGGKVSTLFVRRCVYFTFFGKPLTSPPPQHTWVGAATSASDPPNLPMSPLFVPDDSPLAGFGQLPLQENDGCTAVNHGELDPMQLDSAERATAEETGVRREVTERYAADQEQLRRERRQEQPPNNMPRNRNSFDKNN